MEQQWRLKVGERRPKEADGALFTQAVLGLIKELAREIETENETDDTMEETR
ncbi:hypothetical protein GCM10018980_40140 [Streptomyces capoamus]|uniref:Uncharacterized protein n=1 Tax=Streptomyces capoamus TaxID=68183 RepID=A0A919C6A0_9ACTN|nr:hypothetical protein GCM10010501_26040 [Streptomyces libani subsp. rufus]GHG55011.1 hypothetical protein GCM10018980_40140 [Streptomyces capoamus]